MGAGEESKKERKKSCLTLEQVYIILVSLIHVTHLLSPLAVLGFDGERLRIRKRDDTLMEEHRAYLLVQQIKEEQNKRAKNKNKAKAKAGK